MQKASSPASSGPAGAHFEGQVGASYLLSMLAGSEPRGLPGTIIDSIQFQRAAEGYPLDDVIVHGHDATGSATTLQIQVKRDITFAPKDEVFKKVVGQIALAAEQTDFWKGRHELGIAVSRSSRKIDGPCQDVLTWARQLGDSKTFIERLSRAGSANDDMREFVKTFRDHLGEARVANDDEAVCKLLRRLQIFVFDFTSTGSASEALMKERAVRVLHPEDGSRAGELWKALTELTIEIASAGGDRRRDQLTSELAARSYRLAGVRHNLPTRQTLAEASRNTLDDISDRVGGVMLTRHERLTAVRSALDSGRYVEIRGDAGVGKSGVLKHFAEQAATESAIIALSPTRTVPKGWTMLKAAIGFDGLAYELLSEVAGNGGAILFIDGLDFFGAEERLTAIDLVKDAAKVPGMCVVVTARRDFGTDEPNWLPQEALDKLGRATPTVIDELSTGETEDLSLAAPQLTALLSESHPARPVARNLYRLSRLVNRSSGALALRTEAEMAEEWWLSADGARDAGHRDRARVLRVLAGQILAGADHLTVADLPAAAVEALIASESLRDLQNDRVAFRHDVLREWALGNLLFSDPALVERLPLDRPAPAGLARGLEIAARLTVERTPDHQRWLSLQAAVSKAGVSESWNRAVFLALVRSETAAEILEKASPALFEYRGKMLRELIRIVIAVESEPAGKYYAALGIDPKKIPDGINLPAGPSWMRLILWLLKTGVRLPAAAIPDVVSLCWNWSLVLSGKDPLTPAIMRWFYYWLSELNAPADMRGGEKRPRLFDGELTFEQRSSMAEELRTGFLVFCDHTPELAADYVKKVLEHPYPDRALSSLLKFHGSLAQAAPKELAELTANYLMQEKNEADQEQRRYHGPFREAFGHADLNFVPASPAQGPFYDLLLHAPEYGLPLIRRIVDQAVAFRSGGKDFGKNKITVVLPDGAEIVFPWHQTYGWPRDMGAGPSVVASALMALEAWAHGRIEKGEAVEKVVADVVGESRAPAAYLLVTVDLLLSHWPKSHAAAVPFLACPELLCLDRERVVADNLQMPDIFGLKDTSREPARPVRIDSLKARPSRRSSLDRLLDFYSFDKNKADRAVLSDLLQKAARRLGAPQSKSDLGDPEFMVLHAINRIDPANWRERTVKTPDGDQQLLEYIAPSAECDHLKPLQVEAHERDTNARMQTSIRIALNDATRSSPPFAAAAVKWAKEIAAHLVGDETAQWMRDEAIVIAAMIATRDGDNDLIAGSSEWIRDTFRRAFAGKNDPVHSIRAGLQYNPMAIAFVGTAQLLVKRFDIADVRTLLEAAGRDNPAAGQGFSYVAAVLAQTDERLPRSILRCAFSACVAPWRNWHMSEENHRKLSAKRRLEVASAIESEISWLSGKRDEPEWPVFEPSPAHSRHRQPFVEQRQSEDKKRLAELHTNHRAAALWLANAANIFEVGKRPWLRDLARAYREWTAAANGSELEVNEDPSDIPREWDHAYFNLLVRCLPGLTIAQVDELALDLVLRLPGEAFQDVATIFLRDVDAVYFNGTDLRDAEAVHIRTKLARRLMVSRDWKWQCRRNGIDSVLSHLGPVIAALLFNDFGHFQPAKCYLLPPAIDHLDPFLPLLQEVAEKGTFLFVAATLLNLLEVAPRPSHLDLICAAVKIWLAAHPDSREFWIENRVGLRACSLISAILALDPERFDPGQKLRHEIDEFLGKIIRLGVAEAYRLEEDLRRAR